MTWSKLTIIVLLGFSSSLVARPFDCDIRLTKSNCWYDREVRVQVINGANLEVETMHTISADKKYLVIPLNCNKVHRFTLKAAFDPPIWDDDKGRWFNSQRMWVVPNFIPVEQKQWVAEVCFPDDFSGVPLPLEDFTQCECKPIIIEDDVELEHIP